MAIKMIGYVRKAVFGLVLCLICSSCKGPIRNQDVPHVNVSPSSYVVLRLSGQQIVSRLFLTEDGKMIVLGQHEPFFSVVDVAENELFTSFGRLGRAKGELRSAPQGVNYRDGKLQLFDIASRSFVTISVPDGAMENSLIPVSSVFLPLRAMQIDGMLIATGWLGEGRLAFVKPGQELVQIENYPFDTGSLSGINRGAAIQCDLVCPPGLSRFLLRTMASDCFEIYEVKDSGVSRVFVNDFKYPPVIERARIDYQNSSAGYIRSFVDDANIYLMYSDKSYHESSGHGLVSDMIHVYDWEGHLVRKIILPDEIGAFCVKDSFLFGVLEHSEYSEILRYEL